MAEIREDLNERCKVLAQEIATLQDYNRQWIEIQANAETEENRIEAANAIKTNNDLMGVKSHQVSEILKGSDPFVDQRLTSQATPEPLTDLSIQAIIFGTWYFNLPLRRLLYKPSSISISESEVLLQPSVRRFFSSATDVIVIPKDQICDVDYEANEVQIKTQNNGDYTLRVANQDVAKTLGYRLRLCFSEKSRLLFQESFNYLKAVNEKNKTAWATPVLVAINVAIFCLMVTQDYGIFSPDVLITSDWGANTASLTLTGEWWRLVTSMFIHYGVLHLVLNMIALIGIGPFIERFFGSAKFLFLYFFCGVFASIVSLWYHPWNVSAGASGAIFGVMGAMTAIAFIPKLRPPSYIANILIKQGLLFLLINSVIGLSIPFVDNAAHFGGFIGGAVVGMILACSDQIFGLRRSRSVLFINFAMISAIVIVAYYSLKVNESISSNLISQKSSFFYSHARAALLQKDYTKAITYARRSAELGDLAAPNLVGHLLSMGLGVQQDKAEAAIWFKAGSARGDPYAMMNLYRYYLSEKPDGVQIETIDDLLLEAVRKDYFAANDELMWKLLFSGCNDQEVSRLRNAILDDPENGTPPYIALKGWIYYYGNCVPKDQSRGLKLLKEADNRGAGAAGAMLGHIYRSGSADGRQNLSLAFMYFEHGAQNGAPRAQYELGKSYRDGLGVAVDLDKARFWFKSAADKDYKIAQDALKLLE